MKKLLSKFWEFCTSRFLQILLLIIAFISWIAAERIGTESSRASGKGYGGKPGYDVAITSGHDGGAIAMGLITCVCILGVVWLEINRSKKP